MIITCRLDNSRPVKQMFPGKEISSVAFRKMHHTNPDGRCRLALRWISGKGLKGKMFPDPDAHVHAMGSTASRMQQEEIMPKGIHLALDGQLPEADGFVDLEIELYLKEVG